MGEKEESIKMKYEFMILLISLVLLLNEIFKIVNII